MRWQHGVTEPGGEMATKPRDPVLTRFCSRDPTSPRSVMRPSEGARETRTE